VFPALKSKPSFPRAWSLWDERRVRYPRGEVDPRISRLPKASVAHTDLAHRGLSRKKIDRPMPVRVQPALICKNAETEMIAMAMCGFCECRIVCGFQDVYTGKGVCRHLGCRVEW